MAEILFPKVKLQTFEIRPLAQSIIRHSSIFTGTEQIHSRGIMLMQGTIGWARRNIADRAADIAAIEAFLTRAYGGAMTFKVPVPVDQTTRLVDTAALSIGSPVSDLFETEFNATAGLLVGDWVNCAGRLHKIVEVSATTYKVTPAIVDTTEGLDWYAPTLRARITQQDVALPAAGSWRGPWEVSIQEVVE